MYYTIILETNVTTASCYEAEMINVVLSFSLYISGYEAINCVHFPNNEMQGGKEDGI